ncbi:hypothetical protein EVAR_3094_1 [Eumeta japonica]|uniref:Uncharacterized protein n=1 Tax=Eumeta variegata TaxID=151549 RepID=A0A4C1SU09_EUMVA|nr:hypothetical protein EVAR_3094_1 [Eumeta japonica]
MSDVSEEQGKRFHKDIKEMEKRYQGRWDINKMGDYCCTVQHTKLCRSELLRMMQCAGSAFPDPSFSAAFLLYPIATLLRLISQQQSYVRCTLLSRALIVATKSRNSVTKIKPNTLHSAYHVARPSVSLTCSIFELNEYRFPRRHFVYERVRTRLRAASTAKLQAGSAARLM